MSFSPWSHKMKCPLIQSVFIVHTNNETKVKVVGTHTVLLQYDTSWNIISPCVSLKLLIKLMLMIFKGLSQGCFAVGFLEV